MATVKKDFVFRTIRAEELPFYEISDGKHPIAENQSSRDYEQSCQEIEEVFNSIEDSSVLIKLYSKNKDERGKGGKNHVYHEFRVNLAADRSKAVGGMSVKDAEGYLREIHDLKLQLITKDNEIKLSAFQRQIDELKKGDGESPLIKHAITVLGGLLPSFAKGAGAGVAGVDDAPLEADAVHADAETVLKSALARLSKVDKNILETLTRLAAFAEGNPKQYNQMKLLLPQ